VFVQSIAAFPGLAVCTSTRAPGQQQHPDIIEVTESADYRALVPQSHYAGAIDQAVFEPAAWFTGSGSDFQARVAEVMQACWLSGSSTPEQAVDGLIDRFNTMLAQNPPA